LIKGLNSMPHDQRANSLKAARGEARSELSIAARKGQTIMNPSPKVRAVAAALSQANRKVQVFKKA
jgi:hypothetical protein